MTNLMLCITSHRTVAERSSDSPILTNPLLLPIPSSSFSASSLNPNSNLNSGCLGGSAFPIPSSSSSSPNPNLNLNSGRLGGSASRAFSLLFSSAALFEHAPSRPFTGYAAVLSGSRYLEPALQVLEVACGVGRVRAFFYGDHFGMEDTCRAGRVVNESVLGKEQQWKKARLVSMLDEVCSRYTHYYQQLQAVIQAFESVAGLSTAAPYALMALQTMSKQFKCLTNLISDHLHLTARNPETYRQPPIWRPQRGLPERAVAVLRKWLFEHFLHPYPTDIDKQMLAKHTGLSRNQVSNWFINARVRLWKPMVEEVQSLELSQSYQFPAGDRKIEELGKGLSAAGRGNGGVPLTLALHQSNEVCIYKPLHRNAVRSFGFDYDDITRNTGKFNGNICTDSFCRYL
ncbi:BEL1-like homeodomain protein 9 [Dioscorea cayenensis subsp. rotundata]|uniref:BEL1-like homeodomain protein 9 n=1 Tax=Dioscorea cayennensis subsp. rotundata TaxID=55577 RepID=A0AB40C6Q7_DIOCR|nr:BEL1-like homeodomain protein 9 [Dioscorea cayenensis subsp. rotundata]